MKKSIIFVLLLLPLIGFSQSTEILPGTVLPQMTSALRTGLVAPINGMLVFDTNTQSYWYRQSGEWSELPQAGSASNYWQLNGLSGNEIKNTNSGGFWSAYPTGLTNASNDASNPPTSAINGDGTRLMWIPSRSAFRVGTVDSGTKSWDADSVGLFSFASGSNTLATGKYSTAMGYLTNARGSVSTAMGYNTEASRFSSTAMGNTTEASGNTSTAMGNATEASGNYSTAMGSNTEASGTYSTAMGLLTEASGIASTAIGIDTEASGDYSMATGIKTESSGYASTAMGTRVSTNGFQGSFVIGDYISSLEADSGDTLYATAADQFSARFQNGYRLYTDDNLSAATKYGVFLDYRANSWSSLSDSTKKERFLTYEPRQVLKSIAAMRVGTWNYKGDDRPVGRHWGVMAQDFYHHFGTDQYGTIGCDTLIATADFDGVSFAAIKALELRTRELQEENETLMKKLALKNEKYMHLFAEMRSEMAKIKSAANSGELTAKIRNEALN